MHPARVMKHHVIVGLLLLVIQCITVVAVRPLSKKVLVGAQGTGDTADWSYTSDGEVLGPEDWYKSYPVCAETSQSPINVDTASDAVLSAGSNLADHLHKKGDCYEFKGEETDNTWKVGLDQCPANATLELELNGKNLTMGQVHLHAPSENTLNGKYYAMEAHFVYFDGATPAAVIGVLIEADNASSTNTFLEQFWDKFDNKQHTTTKAINPYDDFFPRNSDGDLPSYYTWNGSLTTPPCTEGLTWMLLTQPAIISTTQLSQYKAALKRLPQTATSLSNNRPIQPLNGRVPELVTQLEWTYTPNATYAKGPLDWGDVNMNCLGETQSPVDIVTSPIAITEDSTLGVKTFSITKNSAQGLQNFLSTDGACTKYTGSETDNTWKGVLDDCLNEASFTFKLPETAAHNAGVETKLKQFHLHAPSEHTVDGEFFDAELHLVHFIDDAPAAVIGVFLQAKDGAPDNPFLEMFWDHFDNQHHETSKAIDPYKDFLPQSAEGVISPYYAYSGSLTTPPCSMGASWFVLRDPVTISKAQLDKYKARLASLPQTSESLVNNRPVQPLYARTITFVDKQ